MTLKRAIKIIAYSNAILLAGLFMGLLSMVLKTEDGKFLIFEFLLAISCILVFLFRKLLITVYLKRTLYPGVFYAVLENLGLTKNIELSLSDDLLNEIYKPNYSTTQFLADNHLKTKIGQKQVQIPFVEIVIIPVFFFIWDYGQKHFFSNDPVTFRSVLLLIAIPAYLWAKEKKQRNDSEPIAFFESSSLILPNATINWKDIYDWHYQSGRKNQPDIIIISHYDTRRNIAETIANLSHLDITKIDFLLLMTHFKGKYG